MRFPVLLLVQLSKIRGVSMNVGIFTFPNSTSYGAALQMYALYHVVESLGHTPEVINYQNAYMKERKHFSRRNWLRQCVSKLLHHQAQNRFRRFEKKRLVRYPGIAISDPRKLVKLTDRYDAVICGSDQVWNPDITGGDLNYFLNFCDGNTRRIAYAPSFGISEFSESFAAMIRGDLEKFHALSVREVPGQALLSELLGQDVSLVCDPTLLITAQEWETLEKPHPAATGDYILYYTIRSSATLWNQCKEFAEEKGLKIVVVGGNLLKQWNRQDEQIRYAVDIGPEEWLYLIHHARYVFTNSFHGTAFSINYRKDFYVEFSSLTNSRLEQITQTLGLCGQIVGEAPLTGAAADYTTADQVLLKIREESMNYLSHALE